ncbi:MAG TPA: hypothetical protein VEA59_00855 [Patescibacteria group bacterium]|nr:hypothetical protein [Patescibacteria group bacterium]
MSSKKKGLLVSVLMFVLVFYLVPRGFAGLRSRVGSYHIEHYRVHSPLGKAPCYATGIVTYEIFPDKREAIGWNYLGDHCYKD